jgi:hypothetical protein
MDLQMGVKIISFLQAVKGYKLSLFIYKNIEI